MKKFICILIVLILFTLPCLAYTNNDFEIIITQIPLSTKLKKYYNGYEYKIVNVSQKNINITNAKIINGNDGNTAYRITMDNEPSALARTWIIAGPIGLFTLGAGWLLGLVATPIVAIVSNNNKNKTKTESISYTNLLNIGNLNPMESVTVNTLAPIGSKVQLTIQYYKNNIMHSITY